MEQHIQHCKGRIISIPPLSVFVPRVVSRDISWYECHCSGCSHYSSPSRRTITEGNNNQRKGNTEWSWREKEMNGLENSSERMFAQSFVSRERSLLFSYKVAKKKRKILTRWITDLCNRRYSEGFPLFGRIGKSSKEDFGCKLNDEWKSGEKTILRLKRDLSSSLFLFIPYSITHLIFPFLFTYRSETHIMNCLVVERKIWREGNNDEIVTECREGNWPYDGRREDHRPTRFLKEKRHWTWVPPPPFSLLLTGFFPFGLFVAGPIKRFLSAGEREGHSSGESTTTAHQRRQRRIPRTPEEKNGLDFTQSLAFENKSQKNLVFSSSHSIFDQRWSQSICHSFLFSLSYCRCFFLVIFPSREIIRE